MTNHHLMHMTDSEDPELYARRLERIAWLRYLRAAKFLASASLTGEQKARYDARRRLHAARADFAEAYRALSEVTL